MPTRVFDQLDVSGVTQGFVDTPNFMTITPTVNTFGDFRLTGSENPSFGGTEEFLYIQTGTVNFDNVPAIPEDALITSIRLRRPLSQTLHLAGTDLVTLTHFRPYDFAAAQPFPSSANPFNYSVSVAGSDADVIFDHSSDPLTYDELVDFYGTQTLSVSLSAQVGSSSPADFSFDGSYDGGWELAVTYTVSYQYYLIEEEVTVDGQTFTVQTVVLVSEGEDPPEGSTPIGDPNTVPDFFWWEFEFEDFVWYLYQPSSPGPLWSEAVAPEDYGWWRSFEEFQGGALLIVNGNPKKPRTFAQITAYSDFMGGFPGVGTVLNHKLIYAGKDY